MPVLKGNTKSKNMFAASPPLMVVGWSNTLDLYNEVDISIFTEKHSGEWL